MIIWHDSIDFNRLFRLLVDDIELYDIPPELITKITIWSYLNNHIESLFDTSVDLNKDVTDCIFNTVPMDNIKHAEVLPLFTSRTLITKIKIYFPIIILEC